MTKIISITLLLISSLTVFSQDKKEVLKIRWPEQYNWKIVSERVEGPLHITDMVPGNEEAGKWGIHATVKEAEGEIFVPMEIAMNNTFNLIRQRSPKANIMLIERDKDAKNHWILFKIESAASVTDKSLESRLFYIIQGESSLFTAVVAVKEKTLSDEFTSKWANIFKNSSLEYKAEASLQGFPVK